jgi:hypothetical protein
MAIQVPGGKDIDSPELAWLFFARDIVMCGVPDNIVIHHGTQLIRQLWTRVCSHLSTDHRLLKAFHPLTDGQTEHKNQTMVHYLRVFCNYEQDNWVKILPLAELNYHYPLHRCTRITPFWGNSHHDRVMQFKAPKLPSSLNSEIPVDTLAAGFEETHQTLHRTLQEAQASQKRYASGKEVVFKFEAEVWHSMWYFRTTRSSKELDYKWTGPYTESQVIKKNADKLDLAYTIRMHNVFHISLLDRYTTPTTGQPPSEPQPVAVDDFDETEVIWNLNSTWC